MRGPRLVLMLFIGLGLILAACAGASSSPGETTGAEPSTPAAQSEAPAESEAQAETEAPAESQAGAEAPALADGPWTGGHGVITVSGGMNLTVDQPLDPGPSITEDAKTLLAYNAPDNVFVTVFINFIGDPFVVSVVDSADFSDSETCEVTYNRADDTGIDATFRCEQTTEYGEPIEPIIIEGTITATR